MITARNPVHAALFLVLAFFTPPASGCCWRAEFLAIALVLVYVGAVMVLFLFVVMMLDINIDHLREGFWKHLPLAAAGGRLMALEMALVLMGGFRLRRRRSPDAADGSKLRQHQGCSASLLYTDYVYPLESPR